MLWAPSCPKDAPLTFHGSWKTEKTIIIRIVIVHAFSRDTQLSTNLNRMEKQLVGIFECLNSLLSNYAYIFIKAVSLMCLSHHNVFVTYPKREVS